MGDNRRMFLHWANMAKTNKTMLACKRTMQMFESMNYVLSTNHDLIFLSSAEDKLKEKVMRILIVNCNNKLKDAFEKWK